MESAQECGNQVFLLMKSVLESGQSKGGTNRGIRVNPKSRTLETYAQNTELILFIFEKTCSPGWDHNQPTGCYTEIV